MHFTGLEETPRLEDIASALHLKWADVVSNWETRSRVEGFLAKYLMDQAQLLWDSLSELNGRYWNWFGEKTHEWILLWTSKCRSCPVLQVFGVLVFKGV